MNNVGHPGSHRGNVLSARVNEIHDFLNDSGLGDERGRGGYVGVEEIGVAMGLDQRRGPLEDALPAHRVHGLGGSAAADDLKQQNTEAVHVAFRGQLVSVHELGGEVPVCAPRHHRPLLHHLVRHELRQSDSHQMGSELFVEKHVAGADVTVDHVRLHLVM